MEFKELSGWQFDADEVSCGIYKVSGVDCQGRNVEATGTDLDALFEKCRQGAVQIMQAEGN